MRQLYVFLAFALLFTGMLSCKKESATLQLTPLATYYPLQAGNSYTYRLDSTLYVDFGSRIAVISYIAKDSIVSTYNDNTGRPSYLVYRYLTDTLMSRPFTYSLAYSVVATGKTIEVTDANNLHYVNMVQPVAAGTTWLGNVYIDTKSFYSDLLYMDNWNYTYQHIDMPFTVLKGSIDSTITIVQEDDNSSNELLDPEQYQQHIYAAEVYARGIGLIYKDFSYWAWQPVSSTSPGYTAQSYGIRLNLISYNVK